LVRNRKGIVLLSRNKIKNGRAVAGLSPQPNDGAAKSPRGFLWPMKSLRALRRFVREIVYAVTKNQSKNLVLRSQSYS
jgi:hypothetical protein